MFENTRRYLLFFATSAITGILALVLLNLAVDPYDLFGTPKIDGFNTVKAVISSKQRVYETVELLQRRPTAIILGTSRSDIGISPSHPAFPQGETFNAAMSGQQIWESHRLLEALVKYSSNKTKTVLIGLDFFAFNVLVPVPFDYSEENFHPLRKVELAFSITTSLDAVRTITHQQRDLQLGLGGLLREDGFRDYIGNPKLKPIERFRGSDDGYLRYTYKPAPSCEWKTRDPVGTFDAYEAFRRILILAHQNNIDLRLFISPSHARQWETLAASGLWEDFENWKRELVKINFEEARHLKRSIYPLWDFSGYNSITTEPVLAKTPHETVNYWESSHYHKEIGDLVLNRIFDYRDAAREVPDDFGTLLSLENIGSFLKVLRQHQHEYRFSQHQEAEDVLRIARLAAKDGPCAHKR